MHLLLYLYVMLRSHTKLNNVKRRVKVLLN